MLAGRMRHRDSAGNEGLLEGGGVQWMVAGSGVVHSELPEQEDGRMEGFQLWLNLPADGQDDHAVVPRHAGDVDPDRGAAAAGGTVRVLAGALPRRGGGHDARRSPSRCTSTSTCPPGTTLHAGGCRPATTRFVYVYQGEVSDRRTPWCEAQRMGVLDNGGQADGVVVTASQDAQFLVIAGQPLNEPIAQYGPFVMNTQEQIYQTLADFREGRFSNT